MKFLVSIMVFVCACAMPAQTNNFVFVVSRPAAGGLGIQQGLPPTATEQQHFWDTVIPLARNFIARNRLSFNTNFGTEAIKRCNIDYGELPGYQATLFLTNGWIFMLGAFGTNAEIWAFITPTKTGYYSPLTMPKGELEAVKALNLRNKLTKEKALVIAKWHFKVMGHKEKDFHPPEFWQLGGDPVEAGKDYLPVPFYEATWYRKDVNVEADSAAGKLMPQVQITVSGITTNIIGYSKVFMPVGHDF